MSMANPQYKIGARGAFFLTDGSEELHAVAGGASRYSTRLSARSEMSCLAAGGARRANLG